MRTPPAYSVATQVDSPRRRRAARRPSIHAFSCTLTRPFPMVVTIQLNQTPLDIEVDTGATASLISEQTYKSLWPTEKAPALQPSEVKLRTYTGEELKVLGAIDVHVQLGTQQHDLSLLVVQVLGPSSLGSDWMVPIRLFFLMKIYA